jgi:Uma2 family endonuclease
MSVTFQMTDSKIEVPDHVYKSLAAFREWAGDNDLPDKTRVDFYKGKVWVDMGKEQVFTHGQLKTEFAVVLGGLIKQADLGHYWCNGVLLTNEDADLSGNPDGVFVSHDAFESGRVTLTEGADEGFVELVGTPDMVLEVVSESSVAKDKVTLRQAYREAGIPEFWLADARGERNEFHILKHGPKGYIETRKSGGWLKSAVFGKSFRLVRGLDRAGNPRFTLESK